MLEAGGQTGSAGSSLEDTIGQMLDGSESAPAPSGAEAGSPTGTPPAAASPTGTTEPAAPVAAPDAPAPTEPKAATPAAPSPPEPDPLADAKPLTYTVNGQERTIEGIKVLGDEAVITREALPDVIRRLGERDHLYERSQWAHQQQQQIEAASAWKTTDANGKESLLTGIPAITEMRITHARNEAALQTLVAALQNPEELRQLVALDEKDQLVLNPAFIANLLTRAELAELKAEQQTRTVLGQLQQAAAPPPSTPDVRQHAPAIIRQAAGQGFASLSAKDQQVLASQMARYVRPTTPAEKSAGQGAQIVDAEFTTLVQEWVALRSEGAKAATVASTAAPEALTSTSTVVDFADIQALSSNTAPLTIGTSAVVHGTTTQRGVKLNAGATWTAYGVNLKDVYVDVGVNSEGVSWAGVVR